jgi:hypothetical protein
MRLQATKRLAAFAVLWALSAGPSGAQTIARAEPSASPVAARAVPGRVGSTGLPHASYAQSCVREWQHCTSSGQCCPGLTCEPQVPGPGGQCVRAR